VEGEFKFLKSIIPAHISEQEQEQEYSSSADRKDQISLTKDQSILESTIVGDPLMNTISRLKNPALMDKETT